MSVYQFYAPTKVVFGKDSQKEVGKLINEQQCKKVLLHYGSNSAKKTGLLDQIEASLQQAGIDYVSLGGVVPNPRLSKVYEGIELCKKENVDFILAVGGGSVIDSAKAIAWGMEYDGDVWDLFSFKGVSKKATPLGCVLTIAAAGSEMSSSCVITNEDGWLKRGHNNDNIRMKFSIMNPELTITLPDYQTACGCVDILMHTLERYFIHGSKMEMTDAIAEGLLRTVIKNSLILKKDPSNYEARAEIMWASSLSHNDLTSFGDDQRDFASHKLEHEIGGMFDVAHGAGLAAVWPSWARYVYLDCLDRFVKFALNVMAVEEQATKEETALLGIAALKAFFVQIDMPITMKELGVEPTEQQLRTMANLCAVGNKGKIGSAKVLLEEDMYQILKAAK